jgi:hypothetical protein
MEKGGALDTRYTNRDFSRTLVYRVIEADGRPSYANGRLTFDIALNAGATWHARSAYVLECSGRVRTPGAAVDFDRLQHEWLDGATRFDFIERGRLPPLSAVGSGHGSTSTLRS